MPTEKRQDILQAALTLLLEKGEQATSMNLVGKQAGCGMGTMYHYFDSKNTLINVLYSEIYQAQVDYLDLSNQELPSVKKKFIFYWTRLMEYAIAFPNEYLFYEQFTASPQINQSTKETCTLLHEQLLEIYSEGQNQGIVKEIDLELLILFNQGALSSAILKAIQSNKAQENSKELVTMAWDSVKS